MIPVVRIYNQLRSEGLNFGLPITTLLLGGDDRLEVEDILREALTLSNKRGWVLVLGERFDSLSYGIGTLVRGLSQLQRYVEIETDGLHRDPSWTHTVDRWVVDCESPPKFNYGSLRTQDTIRVKVPSDLAPNFEELALVLDSLDQFKCAKYVLASKLEPSMATLELLLKHERVRFFKEVQ